MALPPGQSTGTLEVNDVEYLNWHPDDSPVTVHMQLDAVDGILRDVIEGFKALPRRGLEVGGLLLGRVEAGDKPAVWIERYQRISCTHQFGPQFFLNEGDRIELEKAAAGILQSGETAVVGLYRSHTREGFQLEEPDFDLIHRYFSDPSDLILLIKPESLADISARFYVHEPGGGARPAGDVFPLQGRLFSAVLANSSDVHDEGDDSPLERTRETRGAKEEAAPVTEPPPGEHPPRLIPDFAPRPVEPMLFGTRESIPLSEEPAEPSFGEKLKKWLPLIAALLLVGGVIWFALRPVRREPPAAPAAVAEPLRPLGLSIEPIDSSGNSSGNSSGKEWRVSWNPSATALHDARSVQLFVREGDDQTRIDLTPADLAAGIYKYQPMGNDVTFRLEVVDSAGRTSAESFRFERLPGGASPPAAKQATALPATPRTETKRIEPKVIHRAPPIVAAGIRPRIRSTISIDVRVHVDERGRVTSAAPVVKPHQGLQAYLAGSAVQAARQWRFEPARENGKAVAGTEIIHFVFQK